MLFKSLIAAEKDVYVPDELIVNVPLNAGFSVVKRVSFDAAESGTPLGIDDQAFSVCATPEAKVCEPSVTVALASCASDPVQAIGDCGMPSQVQFTEAEVRVDVPKFFRFT